MHARRSVVVKGAADAEAVLCTGSRTYALKIVETTNSLLLVPPVQVAAAQIRLDAASNSS